MPGPISIQYSNFSGVKLQQSGSFTGYGVEKGIGSLSKMPTSTLAEGASTIMEMDENALSNIAGGYAWINLGWLNQSTGYQFGVKIYMPTQVLHIGSQPYYETAYSTNGSGPDWINPVSNPAYPYTFSPQIDFAINCTPTAGHTSLSVVVAISTLS